MNLNNEPSVELEHSVVESKKSLKKIVLAGYCHNEPVTANSRSYIVHRSGSFLSGLQKSGVENDWGSRDTPTPPNLTNLCLMFLMQEFV